MGCDYYIVKQLRIIYRSRVTNKEKETTIELDRQRCYFLDGGDISCDSDDSDYWPRKHARHQKYIDECLHVTFQPRTLFENGQWKNQDTETKYGKEVQEKIRDAELLKIIKEEMRYLR
jgi:hypothetical protein